MIKIERAEGDFARGYDSVAKGQSSYFVWLNRGKHSVTLDLAAPEGKAELKLCEIFLGRSDLAGDPRFATNTARVTNRAETDAVVAAGFATRGGPEAVEALQRADVALASVNDMAGLSAHPHLRRITVDTPNGPISYPAPAPVWHGETPSYGPVLALNTPCPAD